MLRPRAQLRDLGSMTGRICEKGKRRTSCCRIRGSFLVDELKGGWEDGTPLVGRLFLEREKCNGLRLQVGNSPL